MSADDGLQSEARTSRPDGPVAPATAPLEEMVVGSVLVQRLADLVILFLAIVGAVALGLGISDYLTDHPYVLGYLVAYAGFRNADTLLRTDTITAMAPETAASRLRGELPVLLLFAAAPFERTYLFGGEAPESIAALGLLMELAGLWLVVGARIQLRYGAGREGRTVVRSGFYRYIRHPILAGTCMVMFAWPFEYGAPIVAIITLVILGLVTRERIRSEEQVMLAQFGEQYKSYMSETDRLIPNVW